MPLLLLSPEKAPKAGEIQNALEQLTCQKPPEVAGDAEGGNRGEDKKQAHQKTDDIHEKDASRPAQAL